MAYEVSFGRLRAGTRAAQGPAFRLAVLGDFSGRASKGVLEGGAKLASRKGLRVDVDNLDDVLARLAPRVLIPLGEGGETVEVVLACMDDFHPDQLAEALPLFEELMGLRRSLQSRAGFERASKEVLSWAGAEVLPGPETRRARGGAIATDRKLSDFARLTGRASAGEASTEELVRRLVGPHVVPATDSRQEALVGRVDAALSDAMRRVLHHPEFQSTEAVWRGVEMLVRGLETGGRLEIVLYDISAEELAADLAGADALEETALYSLLVEQPAGDADAGPLSLVAGLYSFEVSPPHAELLGRVAKLAAAAGAPFVAGVGPDGVQAEEHTWHPLVRAAWGALRGLPAAVYAGLASPRFLLRMPYGKRTDPIDAFAFEEFTRQGGLSGMLWGNPAVLVAQLAAEAWLKGGKAMALGSVSVVGELPVYVYRDADGDQMALPCTERLFTERQAALVSSLGVMPVVSLRGRPEVRVAGFGSLGGAALAGRWGPVEVKDEVKAAAPAVVPASAPASAPVSGAVAAAAEEEEEDMTDLDALLSDLGAAEEPAVVEAAAEAEAVEDDGDADLDALLADLSVEPPAAEEGETDADLDALLASLK